MPYVNTFLQDFWGSEESFLYNTYSVWLGAKITAFPVNKDVSTVRPGQNEMRAKAWSVTHMKLCEAGDFVRCGFALISVIVISGLE